VGSYEQDEEEQASTASCLARSTCWSPVMTAQARS